MTATQEVLLALASGVLLTLFGSILLVIQPRRAQTVFFGLFAGAWGIQIMVANTTRLVDDPAWIRSLLNASDVFYTLAWFFLARFGALAIGGRIGAWATVLSGAVGVVTLVLLAGWYELFVPLVTASEGGAQAGLGPAILWLIVVPFLATLYGCIVVFYRRYRLAKPGSNRHRERGVLAALVLFTSYYVVMNLFYFLDPGAATAIDASEAVYLVATYGLGAALMGGLFVHLLARPPPPEERDRWLLLAFAVPAGVATLEGLSAGWLTAGATLGFWRLLMVGALVHALARYQLFDLDLKLHWTFRRGSLAGAFVGGFLLVDWAVSRFIHAEAGPYVAMAAVGGLLFAVGPVQRLADSLVGAALPGVDETPDYVAFRKLEVYRNALQEAVGPEGIAANARPRLNRLRQKLGIRPQDARGLEADLAIGLDQRPRQERSTQLPPVEPGAVLADRYRVERFLGQGAHGRAFVAFDQERQVEVAVKAVGTSVYGGQAAAALLREARLVATMNHPNVLRIHAVLEGAHEAAIVMDFAAGGNLHQLLARRGRLSMAEAAEALDQVLAGLSAAHEQGVVHRDIKPENLLMHDDGRIVVADFGVAREMRADATGLDGGAVGTLLYMSPEQIRGGADPRSDLYTAGVLFYQLLTGRFYLPLAGRDDFQVRQLILSEPPHLDLMDRPPWVEAFLLKALAKDPEARFREARAMRTALAAGMGWSGAAGAAALEESVHHHQPAVVSSLGKR